MAELFRALAGLIGLIGCAWLLSVDRRAFSFKTLFLGLAGQVLIALFLLKVGPARAVFLELSGLVDLLSAASQAGSSFVFGYLGGGAPSFEVTHPEHAFVLAFQGLPVIVVITALSALFYHWRWIPWLITLLSHPLRRWFKLESAVGLSAAAMPLLGMVESPLLIRPYLATLSNADLFVVMTGGMATIAGSVMVLYAGFLKDIISDPIGHLLTSALMGIPMAITIARIIHPSRPTTQDPASQALLSPTPYGGAIDAIMQGTMDGVRIVVSIVAVLLVTVALVTMVNGLLHHLPLDLSLQKILGFVMIPVAWGIGISPGDLSLASTLLGEKIVLNELIAFADLASPSHQSLTDHGRVILTYALCSFSNFGSLAILVGGLSAMAPSRRSDFIALAPKAMLAGTIVSLMNGAIVGMIIG